MSDLAATDDPKESDIETLFLQALLKHGNLCLCQASMQTGQGIQGLAAARDRLLARGLIRIMPGTGQRDPELVSFECMIGRRPIWQIGRSFLSKESTR